MIPPCSPFLSAGETRVISGSVDMFQTHHVQPFLYSGMEKHDLQRKTMGTLKRRGFPPLRFKHTQGHSIVIHECTLNITRICTCYGCFWWDVWRCTVCVLTLFPLCVQLPMIAGLYYFIDAMGIPYDYDKIPHWWETTDAKYNESIFSVYHSSWWVYFIRQSRLLKELRVWYHCNTRPCHTQVYSMSPDVWLPGCGGHLALLAASAAAPPQALQTCPQDPPSLPSSLRNGCCICTPYRDSGWVWIAVLVSPWVGIQKPFRIIDST